MTPPLSPAELAECFKRVDEALRDLKAIEGWNPSSIDATAALSNLRKIAGAQQHERDCAAYKKMGDRLVSSGFNIKGLKLESSECDCGRRLILAALEKP